MADEYYHPYRKALNQSQMETNAIWIYNYLTPRGWTLNAIAACLGNWQNECTLNPNRPQRARFPRETGGGFGLAQWTGWYKKYGVWCKSQGIGIVANDNNPSGMIEPQIAFHDYDCKYGVNGKKTWYNNRGYHYSWEEFKRSTDNPATLAAAYYWQYERSAANDPTTRPQQAINWYNFLSNQSYQPIESKTYQLNPFMRLQSQYGNFSLYILYLLIMRILGKKV